MTEHVPRPDRPEPAAVIARRRLAGGLALAGGILGTAAGIVQATAGRRFPDLTGDKDAPLPLGLLTCALSLLAVAAAVRLLARRPVGAGLRAILVTGLFVAGALCFTTVGALWYLPGPLLLAAVVVALVAGPAREVGRAVRANWMRVLVSALGLAYLLLAAAATLPAVALAAAGGVAVFAAPWVAGRHWRVSTALLVAGAVPFAAVTWWSLVSPVVAVFVLGLGLPLVVRGGRRDALRHAQ